MLGRTISFVVVILFSGTLTLLSAAGSSLGLVTTAGSFRLNNSLVSGNATLFEGALIETAAAPSRLQFDSGARVQLSPNSRAKVFKDRLVLEQGYGDLSGRGGYRIEARSLRVAPAAPGAAARVALHGNNLVQVAAFKGTFRVYSSAGILVSNVEAGSALDFEPQQAGPSAPSIFIGCILKKDNNFIIYDQATRMIVILRGTGFEKEWGNRVQVTGTASAAQPSETSYQVLDVTSTTRFGEGGCASVADAIRASLPPAAPEPPAGKPAPTPSTGGMSAGTKVAIATLIIGGGAGGAYAATQLKKENRSQ